MIIEIIQYIFDNKRTNAPYIFNSRLIMLCRVVILG